ncbi:MAG: glycoside hydrolase family 78 protein [Muribaculum sp.]|nr:glycoside hydrolase family 78 protein [Muribaculum sp.]
MRHLNRLYALASALCLISSHAGAFEVVDLKTSHLSNPLGLDDERPVFSWKLSYDPTESPVAQKSFTITVSDENGNDVWDSGEILSAKSVNIPYFGPALKPSTRYRWHLKVYNKADSRAEASSWWETGLLDSGWDGAQWIGPDDSDMTFYPDYLPVFRIATDITIAKGGRSASLLYGMDDPRLLSRDMNIFNLESAPAKSFIRMELSLGDKKKNKPSLNIYRSGYHPDDNPELPLYSLTIPDSIINRHNANATHRLAFNSVLGTTDIWIDGHRLGTVELNPVGRGGDYIAFPVVAAVGFMAPKATKAIFSNAEIGHYRSPARKIADIISEPLEVSGTTIVPALPIKSAPLMRTEFDLGQKPIVKARLYATARGAYDLYLNGNRLTESYLNPGLTEYNKTHPYQTYDVTPFVERGRNAIAGTISEGWWSGGAGFVGHSWNYYGDRQSLLTKIVIEYADSSKCTIVSQPEHWKYTVDGPLRYGSLFQGEVYDATKEPTFEGWTFTDFDDSGWKASIAVKPESKFDNAILKSSVGIDVHPSDTIAAIAMTEPRPGIYVYDLGQNLAGIPHIRLTNLKPGTKIRLRFAEVLYPDMPRYSSHKGMVMLENIRAAMASDIYIARGGNECISPINTYHGFRYIEISGIDSPLPIDNVMAVALTSLGDPAASYVTSNDRVNRLWQNMLWSSKSNFFSIPTDCPQRNERMGWTGDISVFSRTALHIASLYPFLRSYLRSMRDTQLPSGRYQEVVPMSGGFGGLLWGSAGITVPWEAYQMTADTTLLAEHYESMRRYIEYVSDHDIDPETGILVQNHEWGDLGDWLGLEYDRMDKSLIWEAYYIYDLAIMRDVAKILGRDDDSRKYSDMHNKRKRFFNSTYIDSETGKTIFSAFVPDKQGLPVDLQTTYAVPLALGAVDETNYYKFRNNFLATLSRENTADDGRTYPPYSLMTGFIGTAWISKALSDCNASDYAYRLLQQRSFPSWLYPVDQGATTVWERLNSFTLTDGFGSNNSMNSFNHYSFGSVGAWMINYSLGIRRDEADPGWQHFILAPEPDPTGEMTFAKGHFDSPYGRIDSSWRIEPSHIVYDFSIPANTSASLSLRKADGSILSERLTPGRHHYEIPRKAPSSDSITSSSL